MSSWLRDRHRALQILFLVLLAIAATQVSWWIYDQTSFTREVLEDTLEGWRDDRTVAEALLQLGVTADRVRAWYPHLIVTPTPGVTGRRVELDVIDLEMLHDRRNQHLRQYLFEGGFFMFVLFAAMAVTWQVLDQEKDLRQRQQNLLASVSHELKSPLASLRLTTETLAMREMGSAKRAELLERSLGDLSRLEGLVSSMLDTLRLEEGKVRLVRERLRLGEEIRAAMAELGYSRERSGVEVELAVPEGLELYADRVGVRTVLRNLIDNAIEACSSGPRGKIRISGEAKDQWVELRVEDDGAGFDPELSERLFEKFYRPGSELRRKSRGTGLGLYIVRGLVELEGGRIVAHSAGQGQGARFEVSWPRREEMAV